MSRLPAAGENSALAAVLVPTTTYYLSLHSADPGTTGANEFSGGGYVRQGIAFGTPTSGSNASTNGQTVPNAGTTAATHYGIWSASTSGTFLIGGALSSSVTSASIVFATGAVTFSVS